MLSQVEPIDAPATARRCFTAIASPARTLIAPADIVFIPGGGSGAFKRWAWQHYVRLADLLKKSLGNSTTFTFVLGPDEKPERERLRALHRGDFRLEFGRSIPELACLMLSARLVVANDCGPSHLAHGACVPYVGIFNAPNSEWFWQRSYTRDVTPDNGTENINTITPERVLPSCLTLLRAFNQGGTPGQ